MAMPGEAAEQFLKRAEDSGAIRPEETVLVRTRAADGAAPRALADDMLARGWITAFQAERLLADRAGELNLGQYVLLEPLGEGGMGLVFKARHRLMNRVVALKLIRGDLLARPDVRARFLREIEAAARVWHPNLVAALDAAPLAADPLGEPGLALVMEYVEGRTLADVLRSEGLPPIRHACDWARQAALGLGHAHEQGLVHRDIKPSNLILTGKGLIKVVDLGLARIHDPDERPTLGPDGEPLTASGIVLGTPDYLAPEQADDPHAADGRSDIYSLGCTLFHLLTGQPPFPGGSLTQKLLKHQSPHRPDPAYLRPALPKDLAAIVLRMIDRNPSRRPPTAEDVALALDPFCRTSNARTLIPTIPISPTPPPIVPDTTTPTPATYTLAGDPDLAPSTPSTPNPLINTPPDDDSWWRDDVNP